MTIADIPILTMARSEIRAAAQVMPESEARHLVDLYYQIQDFRIQGAGIVRAQGEEPSLTAGWVTDQMRRTEEVIQKALDDYTDTRPEGRWAKSVHGIGPVITAGLLGHIDIERAPTAGHIWRFAGLDPTVRWGKGEKRPWNAKLKTLCWKIGDSFVKFSGSDKCFYGHLYRQRKAQEVERNEAGAFADQAARALEERNIKDAATVATYKAGRLPDGRIDLRARRYAEKLFLAHLHHVMYEVRYNTPPPKPYVGEHLGHVHLIGPPGWPME